jgi:hypothetical protein
MIKAIVCTAIISGAIVMSRGIATFAGVDGERTLGHDQLWGLFGGFENDLCCEVITLCQDEFNECKTWDTKDLCILPSYEDTAYAVNNKACTKTVPYQQCDESEKPKTCREVYRCIWVSMQGCYRGSKSSDHYSNDSCVDDCP